MHCPCMTAPRLTQHGLFLITSNARDREPWCVFQSIPEMIIMNLLLTKRIQGAKLYAFCILPDHMHLIIRPGKRGISQFMQSFKMNSAREIRRYRKRTADVTWGKIISVDLTSYCEDDDDFDPDSNGESAFAVAVKRLSQNLPTAEQISLQGCGVFRGWQHGFHDRLIHNDEERAKAMRYVENNAARHRLVPSPARWSWTSLNFQHVIDPLP